MFHKLTIDSIAARGAGAAVLAELDLLMAVDGYSNIADLRAAGAQRI
jgi:hypothetical protein